MSMNPGETTGMKLTAGLDVGSTYTKVILYTKDEGVIGKALRPTGFKLDVAAKRTLEVALEAANLKPEKVAYTIVTGYGRHRVDFADARVTDLTAAARGAKHLYPNTGTVLDIGGQTMKASRVDQAAKGS